QRAEMIGSEPVEADEDVRVVAIVVGYEEQAGFDLEQHVALVHRGALEGDDAGLAQAEDGFAAELDGGRAVAGGPDDTGKGEGDCDEVVPGHRAVSDDSAGDRSHRIRPVRA